MLDPVPDCGIDSRMQFASGQSIYDMHFQLWSSKLTTRYLNLEFGVETGAVYTLCNEKNCHALSQEE